MAWRRELGGGRRRRGSSSRSTGSRHVCGCRWGWRSVGLFLVVSVVGVVIGGLVAFQGSEYAAVRGSFTVAQPKAAAVATAVDARRQSESAVPRRVRRGSGSGDDDNGGRRVPVGVRGEGGSSFAEPVGISASDRTASASDGAHAATESSGVGVDTTATSRSRGGGVALVSNGDDGSGGGSHLERLGGGTAAHVGEQRGTGGNSDQLSSAHSAASPVDAVAAFERENDPRVGLHQNERARRGDVASSANDAAMPCPTVDCPPPVAVAWPVVSKEDASLFVEQRKVSLGRRTGGDVDVRRALCLHDRAKHLNPGRPWTYESPTSGRIGEEAAALDKFVAFHPDQKYTPARSHVTGLIPIEDFHSQEGEDFSVLLSLFRDELETYSSECDRTRCEGRESHVYVEIGAYDGSTDANTFVFDRRLGWSGLLVEANADVQKKHLSTRPGAKSAHAAVCATAGEVRLTRNGLRSTLKSEDGATGETVNSAQCVPMRELERKHGITHVDFYSVDVEGMELELLQSRDWDNVPVQVMLIEMNAGKGVGTRSCDTDDIRQFLGSKGMCRLAADVGHSNELWVNEADFAKRRSRVRGTSKKPVKDLLVACLDEPIPVPASDNMGKDGSPGQTAISPRTSLAPGTDDGGKKIAAGAEAAAPAGCTARRPDAVIYNRIPKTGSGSFLEWVQAGAWSMGGHLQVIKEERHYKRRYLDEELRSLASKLYSEPRAAIHLLHGHFFFYDFTRGFDRPLAMINFVRDPVDRCVSAFYWTTTKVAADARLPGGRDVNEFAKQGGFDLPSNGRYETPFASLDSSSSREEWALHVADECNNYAVKWFCGHADSCQDSASAKALDVAWRNIVTKYAFVGVTEEMALSVSVLAKLMPGIVPTSGTFSTTTVHKANYLSATPSTMALLAKKNANDYELYSRVRDLLHHTAESCGL